MLLTGAVSLMALAGLVGNLGHSQVERTVSAEDEGSVYYLNFKPEVEDVWNKIAEDYTAETGVPVKVVTAASGNYESTLKAEITKADAPTLFQINGPIGYLNWKDYTKDLKDTEIYAHLVNKELAVTEGEGVYGIPYVCLLYTSDAADEQ